MAVAPCLLLLTGRGDGRRGDGGGGACITGSRMLEESFDVSSETAEWNGSPNPAFSLMND